MDISYKYNLVNYNKLKILIIFNNDLSRKEKRNSFLRIL